MEEIWKDVEGWEDRYMVSNIGRVYSKSKKTMIKTRYVNGYESIGLNKNGKRVDTFVHRLVAKAFIPNPDNLPIINHKDENPSNNRVDNLEWCTYKYNNTYNDIHIRKAKKTSRTVYQYDCDGNLISEFCSSKDASRVTGISNSNICDCCNGKLHITHNNVFSYTILDKEDILKRFKTFRTGVLSKKNNLNSKTVNQYDLEMNFIASYPSAREASRQLGFSQSLISSVCRKELVQTHGFVFRYA